MQEEDEASTPPQPERSDHVSPIAARAARGMEINVHDADESDASSMRSSITDQHSGSGQEEATSSTNVASPVWERSSMVGSIPDPDAHPRTPEVQRTPEKSQLSDTGATPPRQKNLRTATRFQATASPSLTTTGEVIRVFQWNDETYRSIPITTASTAIEVLKQFLEKSGTESRLQQFGLFDSTLPEATGFLPDSTLVLEHIGRWSDPEARLYARLKPGASPARPLPPNLPTFFANVQEATKGLKNWEKRFIRASKNYLCVYRNENDNKPLGVIDLSKLVCVDTKFDKVGDKKVRKMAFQLSNARGTTTFLAESREQRDECVAKIQRIREMLAASDGSGGNPRPSTPLVSSPSTDYMQPSPKRLVLGSTVFQLQPEAWDALREASIPRLVTLMEENFVMTASELLPYLREPKGIRKLWKGLQDKRKSRRISWLIPLVLTI